MRVSVFGLGYVGAVTSACLCRDGHTVVGVDISVEKVDLIANGQSPIVEPLLPELLHAAVVSGSLSATTNTDLAVLETDVSFVSVGTPPGANGAPDLTHVYEVSRQIGNAIRVKGEPHVVVFRSTVPPGTLDACTAILRQECGPVHVHTAFNPEFLREGAAVKDYDAPPFTVIGTEDPIAEQAVREIYAGVKAPVMVVPPGVAELVKQVSNAWHATKITFANEIGRLAKAYGVDGRAVMDLMARDAKLNCSPAYLKPGFAYGGSCLPKDISALISAARSMNIDVPLLEAVPDSNLRQIELAEEIVSAAGVRRIALLGLAFKPGTDDLRESPMVRLVKLLLGEGCEVRIHDEAVHKARLVGTNLAFIRKYLPHFETLLVPSLEDALCSADAVIVAHSSRANADIIARLGKGKLMLDLAGLFATPPSGVNYYALGWQDSDRCREPSRTIRSARLDGVDVAS